MPCRRCYHCRAAGRYRHESEFQPSADVPATRKKQTSTGGMGDLTTWRLQKDSGITFRGIFRDEFIPVGHRIHTRKRKGGGDATGKYLFRLLFGYRTLSTGHAVIRRRFRRLSFTITFYCRCGDKGPHRTFPVSPHSTVIKQQPQTKQ